ncbi:MAG: phosphoribosylanthranilate isomerase [Candidatus Omnitrophota bacterium]
MVKIKFCGLRTPEEVRWAEELKANFIGFNLYPKSPRYVSPDQMKELVTEAKSCQKVALFVNSEPDEIARLVKDCGLDLVQLHGDESPEFCRKVKTRIGKPIIKAFRLATTKDLEVLKQYRETVDYFLLDTKSDKLYGGTGETFPWDLAVQAKRFHRPIFLAGGLTPENVTEACRQVNPFAVDVASGVEEKTGLKSREKMSLFVRNARN